jgi:hypothetical protein
MTAARYRAACAALGLPVWRPGMRTSSKFERVVTVDTDTGDPACAEAGATEDDCACVWMPCDAVEPDFTDPATVGCLLAAVREVLCAAYPAAERIDLHIFDDGQVNLGHDYGIGVVSGATLADALIAALEAAAARRGGQP